MNQWWPSSTTHIWVTRPQWVNVQYETLHFHNVCFTELQNTFRKPHHIHTFSSCSNSCQQGIIPKVNMAALVIHSTLYYTVCPFKSMAPGKRGHSLELVKTHIKHRYLEQFLWNCPHVDDLNWIKTLRARQNGSYFSFKLIFLNENVWISITCHLSLFLWI